MNVGRGVGENLWDIFGDFRVMNLVGRSFFM